MKSASLAALTAATLLTTALATPASPAAAAGTGPVACPLTTFDTAEVVPDTGSRTLVLVVTGTTPSTNITVKLVPAIYIQQPEYWQITVRGCTSGIGLPVITPYAVKLDVTHTVGTIGIEVVDSNGSKQIPVVPVVVV